MGCSTACQAQWESRLLDWRCCWPQVLLVVRSGRGGVRVRSGGARRMGPLPPAEQLVCGHHGLFPRLLLQLLPQLPPLVLLIHLLLLLPPILLPLTLLLLSYGTMRLGTSSRPDPAGPSTAQGLLRGQRRHTRHTKPRTPVACVGAGGVAESGTSTCACTASQKLECVCVHACVCASVWGGKVGVCACLRALVCVCVCVRDRGGRESPSPFALLPIHAQYVTVPQSQIRDSVL